MAKTWFLPWLLSEELVIYGPFFTTSRSLCIERGGYQVMSFLAGCRDRLFAELCLKNAPKGRLTAFLVAK